MGANFTPTFGAYSPLTPFRYWCQKVLPLVYDDSLSYYECLNKTVDYLNKTMEDVETLHGDTEAMLAAFNQLQTYVNTYFDELDLTEEVQTVLDRMAENGSLDALLRPLVGEQIGGVVAEQIDDAVAGQIYDTVASQINDAVIAVLNGSTIIQNGVENWLDEHIPTGDVVVDNTLSIHGAAADALSVGNIIVHHFSIQENYNKDDYVLYNGVLYQFTAVHTAGVWTGNDAVTAQIMPIVSDMESALSAEDDLINDTLGFVNYDYDTPYYQPKMSSGTWRDKIGIKRNRTIVVLNKTDPIVYNVIIRLTGKIELSGTNSTTESWDEGITLKPDHEYSVSAKLLSGESLLEAGGVVSAPGISVYPTGTHTSIGTLTRPEEGISKRTFTPSANTEYNLGIYIPSNQYIFTDAKFLITLEDLTESKLYNAEKSIVELNANTNYLLIKSEEQDENIESAVNRSSYRSIGELSAVPGYKIPEIISTIRTEHEDSETVGSVAYKMTQSICSDGRRYIYYPLTTAGTRTPSGFYVNTDKPIIRKWDTWTGKLVASTGVPNVNYGHVEDMTFVPYDVPGLDGGNVDRIYIVDGNHSALYDPQGNIIYDDDVPQHTTGRIIHVIAASDLSYIGSFETENMLSLIDHDISSDQLNLWTGINHVCCSPTRGRLMAESPKTVDNTAYHCFALFNANGIIQKAIRFICSPAGTLAGFDSDDNFIYMTRYTSVAKQIYVFDWELNPVSPCVVNNYLWEFEGICHIGETLFTTWNQEVSERTGAIIAESHVTRNKFLTANATLPDGWAGLAINRNSIKTLYAGT